jgi:ParB family transcriptional regulator, chromosome partitioning protein
MKQTVPELVHIDVDLIKPMIRRSRHKEPFEEMKATIDKLGLKMPIQVRDISERAASKRKREDGGHYRYELICGQGRLEAFRELGEKKIPALIIEAKEVEILGRFLAENELSEPLPWAKKAQLVKDDLDAGKTHEWVAKRLFISVKHVQRYERILSRTGADVQEAVFALPVGDAELLTTLPGPDQAIVMDVMSEIGERQVKSLVNKAREVREETGDLSKAALKLSLKRVEEERHRVFEKLNVVRAHHAFGPVNLKLLFADKKFRKAAMAEGVNVAKFEDLVP